MVEAKPPRRLPTGPAEKLACGAFRVHTFGMFRKLRAEVARLIGIDPDRIEIRDGDEAFHFVVTVQGAISGVEEHTLRDHLNSKSEAHITWTVNAVIS